MAKKQDDKNLKILREKIATINGNKVCFDCAEKGTTYINMTIGSFVCTRCSGILRGLTPPQRVKSISMATFTADELDFIRSNGNDNCAKTWMGLWDPKRVPVQDHRELLVDKYEKKRYYLEPASPLKSITTSQQLTSAATTTTAAAATTDNGLSALKAITLTPPTSLRLYKNNSQHQQAQLQLQQQQQQLQLQQQQQQHLKQNLNATNNFKQQFTPDDSNNRLFNQTTNQQQIRLNNNININNNNNNSNNSNNNLDINGLNRNGLNLNVVTSNIKNGLNIGIENNNKFTPDTEFVADFGSANIFNSTTTTTNNHINNNNNHINSNHNLNNGKMVNGTSSTTTTTTNGGTTNGENFADFDHNPIYNAAAKQNSSNNMQWNVWQQFQWPFVQPEQNRWSLPMSLSSTSNSLHSSGTYNSNSSISSTPSADRYAALKDLDEQLRENKEKADTNIFNTQAPPATVNPFKTGNPFQQQQQQQQQLQQQQVQNQHVAWPQDPLFTPTNNYSSHLQQQQQFHHNMNGFGSQLNNVGTAVSGFHHQQQQGIIIGNGFGATSNQSAFGNPFSSAGSTNNPFL